MATNTSSKQKNQTLLLVILLLLLTAGGMFILYLKMNGDLAYSAENTSMLSRRVEQLETKLEKMNNVVAQPSILAVGAPTTGLSTIKIENSKIGLSFSVPAQWGAGEFTEDKSMCYDNSGKLTSNCLGSQFHLKMTKMSICGSTKDFTVPRGAYYCDERGAILEKNGSFEKTEPFTAGAEALRPTKVYVVNGGKVLLFSGEAVTQMDENGMRNLPKTFALVSLKGKFYQTAWIDFGTNATDTIETIIKSFQITQPTE
ncbi:hypothetical protein KBC54_02315 [Patescibacteria group bacterium]|nr:hypothetical protein [Patescibacteria group bacterium]